VAATPFADRLAAGRALGGRVAEALRAGPVSGGRDGAGAAGRGGAGAAGRDGASAVRRAGVVVLGLPRGGVVVAARVAEALDAPLGVVVARKVRSPGTPELAMGAVAVWGPEVAAVRISHVTARAGVGDAAFARACAAELGAARERAAHWQPVPPPVADRTVVVVDDGLATGATMRAALAVLRKVRVGGLVAAVPVGPPPELRDLDAEVVCLLAPDRFGAVGAHYLDFGQVDDETVEAELARAARRCPPPPC
jgi:predicted phosphoribosyltransferase